MKDSIFRTYDIRGIVGTEFLLENAYDLGKAIAYFFISEQPNIKKIAIGMDGRIHSEQIMWSLSQALQDSGIDVYFIGLCHTPMLYFSLFNFDFDAGLMVTASHNTKEYNGIKICHNKNSVWGDDIQLIKKYFVEKKSIESEFNGSFFDFQLKDFYVNWFCKNFSHLKSKNFKVLIDCANGATGAVLPDLVKIMDWQNVKLLYPEVDGTYPNHEADPVVAKNMAELKKRVMYNDFDLGIGFDGDGDRMAPITKSGYLVPGDKLLALFAKDILDKSGKQAIVFDVKCSDALFNILKLWGADPIVSPFGPFYY